MQTSVLQGEKSAPLFSRNDLIKLIIPLVIEQFLMMSVGMADTVMVTSTGEAAVSGVSLVDNINLLLIQIFAALATGGAVIVSQYLGRQEVHNARKAAKQLLYTVFVLSSVLMIFALIFREHILSLIFGNIEPDVMDSALLYFLSTALSYPFIAVYNAGAALFRSLGNSKISMFNSLIMNIVNITVNAILIYGFDMGALGAGIGTLSSRMVAAVVILILLQRPDNPLQVEKLFRPEFHGSMVRRILTVGIPNGLENGMFQVGKILVLSLVTSFGTNAVAANAISGSVASVLNVPGQAIGLAMITVVGRCMGGREVEQAQKYTKKLMALTYLCMGVMCVLLLILTKPLVSLFNLSEGSARMAEEVLRWCAVFTMFFWPLSFTLPNALRASGDVVYPMVISLASMFICRIGFSYLLASPWGLHMQLLGVWIAMFLDWIVRDIAFVIRYLRGKWKTINVI